MTRLTQLTVVGWVCVVATACRVLCKRVNTARSSRFTLGTLLKQVHNFLLHFHPWYIVGSLRDGQESRRKARSNESPPLVENLSGTCGSWSTRPSPGSRGKNLKVGGCADPAPHGQEPRRDHAENKRFYRLRDLLYALLESQ